MLQRQTMFGQTASPGAEYPRPMSAYGGSQAGMAYPMQMNVSAPVSSGTTHLTFASESQHDVGNGQPLRRAGNDGRQHGLSKFPLYGHVRCGISIRRRNTRRWRGSCTTRSFSDDDADATDDVSRFIHDASSNAQHGIPRISLGNAPSSAFDDAASAYGRATEFHGKCDRPGEGRADVGRMNAHGRQGDTRG